MEKQLFIYNYQSGKGLKPKALDKIIKYLTVSYPTIIICPTRNKGDAKDIAKKYLGQVDKIFVLGGDGTINDVITAIVTSTFSPTLVLIPNGTMNDLAHTLNIPKDYRKAIDLAKTNKADLFDVIKVNDNYAVYGFALGRFSSTSYNTTQKAKNKFGKLAYFVNASKEVFRYSPMQLNIFIDDKKLSGKFALALVTNSTYVAGFKINKRGKNSPLLILIQEKDSKLKNYFSSLISMLKLFLFGIDFASKDKLTTIVSFNNLYIISESENCCVIDGEKFSSTSFELKFIPKQIKIVHNITQEKQK